jgi:hypothetical protein
MIEMSMSSVVCATFCLLCLFFRVQINNHDDTLAEDERPSRSRSQQHSKRPVSRGESESSSTDPPAKRAKVSSAPLAPVRDGVKQGKRAKAGDYEQSIKHLLLRASYEYGCRIATLDAFPDETKQLKWVDECWKNACNHVEVEYAMDDKITKVVRVGSCLFMLHVW